MEPTQFTLYDLSPRLTRAHLMHSLRTAIAAGATLAIAPLLGMEHGYWAAISAVIVMQARLGGSVMAGWARVAGTGVGAVVGVLCVQFMGTGLASFMIGTFAAVTVCQAVPWLRQSMRIGAVTVAIVMLAHLPGTTPLIMGIERFFEIVLGIVVALLVSFFVFPARAARDAAQGLADELALDAALLETVYSGASEPEYPARLVSILKGDVIKARLLNRRLIGEARREPSGGQVETLGRLLDLSVATYENILSMAQAARVLDPSGYRTHMAAPMDVLVEVVCQHLEHLAIRARSMALRKGPEPLAPPPLEPCIERVQEALQRLRNERMSSRYPLDEIINFFTFVHGLLEIARRLAGLEAARRAAAESRSGDLAGAQAG
ncbi:MAG: FUSC family protein [Desulfovibrionaceae bacterium]|jgi:uncharacterized membrane protein YccC|nr:FUSC family protein [Desulfovibrionaceae bacterium]